MTVKEIKKSPAYKKIPRGTKYQGVTKSKLKKTELCKLLSKKQKRPSPKEQKREPLKKEQKRPVYEPVWDDVKKPSRLCDQDKISEARMKKRKSPPYHAKSCKGLIKRGLGFPVDLWKSMPYKRKGKTYYKWVKFNNLNM